MDNRGFDNFILRSYLAAFPYNAIKSGHLADYYEALTDFKFLQAKINDPRLGVQKLIEDYDLIDKVELSNYSESNLEENKTLQLIQETLRLSAHILNQDPTQLASQLWGRLLSFTSLVPQYQGTKNKIYKYFWEYIPVIGSFLPKYSDDQLAPTQPQRQNHHYPLIQSLLEQAQQNLTDPYLLPYTPSLTPPGTPLIRTLIGHSSSVSAVCVTPNGQQVISGSWDDTLKVWDLAKGTVIKTLTGHSRSVTAVCVTPNGQQVISGSEDDTLKVWDLAKGKCLATFMADASINCCEVAPDGVTVVAGDGSGQVYFLRLVGLGCD